MTQTAEGTSTMYDELIGPVYWTKVSYIIQTDSGYVNGPIWIGLDPDMERLRWAPQPLGGPAEGRVEPFSVWVDQMEDRKGAPLDGVTGDKICMYPSGGGNIGFGVPEPAAGERVGSMSNPHEQYVPFIKQITEQTPLRVLVG